MPPIESTTLNDPAINPHVINYISTSLSTDEIDKIPIIRRPSSDEISRVTQTWQLLYNRYNSEIVAKLRHNRNTQSRNLDLERTLEGLKVHSLSLRDDPHVDVSEDELRSILPSDTYISAKIESFMLNPPFQPIGKVDAEVLVLAKWFKEEYMKWIDPILCSKCNSKTFMIGMSEPNYQERQDGAGRVELHKCSNSSSSCGETRRFCRYGKIKSLIKNKEGRCGEWAQLFYVFLRVRGIESRYIWNSEDHVWCEYWSPTLRHWVHVDSCEAATNKPLLYARGWGKKQGFCLAFGPYGAEDVTRAYVDDWEECRTRRRAKGWKEFDLKRSLNSHTVSIRLRLPSDEISRLNDMDIQQKSWINNEKARFEESERMDLGGRISGPEDWRKMRDELGLGEKVSKKPEYKVTESLDVRNDQILKYGNARLINTNTFLLSDGPSQTSSIFHPKSIPQNQNFRSKVKFRLTSFNSGEADGIAFIFTKDEESKLGLGGYGLGYDGLGEEGDFAIEIDTYRTQDYADDPPTPHISIHSPLKAHHKFSLEYTKPNSIPFLSNGKVFELEILSEITHDGEKRIRVYLITPDKDELQVIDTILPEPKLSQNTGNDHWWLGISGACGGLWQKQEILDWQIDLIEFDDTNGNKGESKADIDDQQKKAEVKLEKDQV
ncbi:uncharacterized protein L201_002721 [Kwoniella dendrophila CBS 6074]|uniref:Transglutaminase-like domain-containing protein n=1 Tax=Kwoniella dendrophila CBS 6074 TaxID=1295534 RepID=A0AAX4JSH9_9TREE